MHFYVRLNRLFFGSDHTLTRMVLHSLTVTPMFGFYSLILWWISPFLHLHNKKNTHITYELKFKDWFKLSKHNKSNGNSLILHMPMSSIPERDNVLNHGNILKKQVCLSRTWKLNTACCSTQKCVFSVNKGQNFQFQYWKVYLILNGKKQRINHCLFSNCNWFKKSEEN